MTEQAKSLNELFAEICKNEGGRKAWEVWLKKIRAEYPQIDQINPMSAKHEEFVRRIQPLFDEYFAHKNALQRIENGASEYEEIMGLSHE